MRSLTLACFLLTLATSDLQADSLGKPYFAATHPGTWARYESTWERPDGLTGTNIYTYLRAPDDGGRVRIEVDTETQSGPGAGTVSRQLFIMEQGFDWATRLPDRMAYLEASVAQTGDGPASLTQDMVIDIMRKSAGDLTKSVRLEGRTTREGRECDNHAYSYESGGSHVTKQEGEICLDASIPFGIVFQTGRIADAEGKPVSSYEQKLLDFGEDRAGTAALLAMTPKSQGAVAQKATPVAVPSLELMEAYEAERIRLLVLIDPDSGGRHLEVRAVNKIKDTFELVVPTGAVTLPAGSPLGTLSLVFDSTQRFTLSPGATSPPFKAGQSGRRGAISGDFQLTLYEGQPLYQGTVKVGTLK